MLPTSAQFRAARALLNMSQERLAKLAGVSPPTLAAIENGKGDPRMSSVVTVAAKLGELGVIFTEFGVTLATDESAKH